MKEKIILDVSVTDAEVRVNAHFHKSGERCLHGLLTDQCDYCKPEPKHELHDDEPVGIVWD